MAFQLTGFQRDAFQIKDLQKVGGGGNVVRSYDRQSHKADISRRRRDDDDLLLICRAWIDKVLTMPDR